MDERGAVTGDVAHARGRAALLAVDALRVLATGHLHAPWRIRELHRLVAGGGYVLEGDAAAADQVGRAGQDLQRGDAAGAGGVEAGILRPDRMLCPDVGGDRRGRLVAVRMRAPAGAGVHTQEIGRAACGGRGGTYV